jgi:hypothetical protein
VDDWAVTDCFLSTSTGRIPFLVSKRKGSADRLTWLIANALFGVAVIPVMVWVSRSFGDRMAQAPFVQRLMDDIAGRSLTGAKAFLDQVAIFEREDVHAA